MKKKNVLFFSDFGIDDFVAIIFAFFSEEINIVGIVADYGNVSREDALRNAAYLRELTGQKDIPVFSGAVLPLTGEVPIYYPDVHGLEGLGPIVPKIEQNIDLFENFDEFKELVDRYENDICIVNVGRLSSLAAAFILYPGLMGKVKDFYIMGGAFNVPGNVTPVAEANFYGDPYAANVVFDNAPVSIHVFPLDVTMSAIITPALIDALDAYYQSVQNKVGLLVKPMVDYYFQFYKNTYQGISGSPLHDLFTFWAMLDMAEVQYREVPVKIIVNRGEAFGQSIGDFRNVPPEDKMKYRIHKIAVQFNYSSFIKTFYDVMTNHKTRTP
ncbi:nucleoside hydrolase [Bacillus sp. ISL-47]|uniref:nucleoside hydrolase n=1 Tax=Bacillus sp. ISL-47 TaxID=2819130 RepID=UPI001BEBCB2C|nr:nucleoside hydrolase [Bacillus sp. ISL-47]MBT2690260.1 nucleoside hydrolase [Bacillus sp. ISL-47]MBT2708976.1 nucleoside hydrolase [Pseudomonas sp. ISL-84]